MRPQQAGVTPSSPLSPSTALCPHGASCIQAKAGLAVGLAGWPAPMALLGGQAASRPSQLPASGPGKAVGDGPRLAHTHTERTLPLAGRLWPQAAGRPCRISALPRSSSLLPAQCLSPGPRAGNHWAASCVASMVMLWHQNGAQQPQPGCQVTSSAASATFSRHSCQRAASTRLLSPPQLLKWPAVLCGRPVASLSPPAGDPSSPTAHSLLGVAR